MELDKALQLAVIAAWDDLMKASQQQSGFSAVSKVL
jgi:hypothetical protein